MMLHNKIADMNSGEVVEIRATDPSTQRDIPKFCGFLGHELIDQATEQDEFRYWIRKGG